MSVIFEDRANYSPEKDSVGVIALTVECNPGQVDAVLDFLAQVRDRAGVYSVDYTTTVRPPQVAIVYDVFAYNAAPPALEIVTLAPVADEIAEHEAEGEVHAELEIQPAGGASDTVEVGDGEAVARQPAPERDHGEDGAMAGHSGEGEPGSISGSAESSGASET